MQGAKKKTPQLSPPGGSQTGLLTVFVFLFRNYSTQPRDMRIHCCTWGVTSSSDFSVVPDGSHNILSFPPVMLVFKSLGVSAWVLLCEIYLHCRWWCSVLVLVSAVVVLALATLV